MQQAKLAMVGLQAATNREAMERRHEQYCLHEPGLHLSVPCLDSMLPSPSPSHQGVPCQEETVLVVIVGRCLHNKALYQTLARFAESTTHIWHC